MKTEDESFLSFFQPGSEHQDAALAYKTLRLFVFPLRANGKEPLTRHGFQDATTHSDQIKEWWPVGSADNIGIALPQSNTVVIDIDPRNGGDKSFEDLVKQHGQLTRTYTVKTAGGGWHHYFRVPPDFYDEASYPKQLASGVELLVNGYVVAPPSQVADSPYIITNGDPKYEFAPLPFRWLESVFSAKRASESLWKQDNDDFVIPDGERNNQLASLCGHLRNLGFNEADIVAMASIAVENHFQKPEELLIDDLRHGNNVVRRTAESICKYPPHGIPFYQTRVALRKTVSKPVLDETALYGPLGEFVKRTLPLSEAPAASLMFQALTMFGNMIGAKTHQDIAPGFTVEKAHHRTALYSLIVGDSAQAAKGDSFSQVTNFLSPLDPSWEKFSGVQTGEGIIALLADDLLTGETTTINGETLYDKRKGGQVDRRALVFEPEFGRVIHTGKRLGSVTKDVIKDLWDGGTTQHITASTQKRVTGVTFSYIAHITEHEMNDDIPKGDFMNGFLNRFMMIHAERTQVLPAAPGLSRQKSLRILEPLVLAMEYAQDEAPEEFEFSNEAMELWIELIHKWADTRTDEDIIDAMQARARPNVRRMAMIYAVSCLHDEIELEDLEAAVAMWQYHYDTCGYLFPNFLGDKDATTLFRALQKNPLGISITDISQKVFNGNRSTAQIKRAIEFLKDRGLAMEYKERRQGSRKSASYIRLVESSGIEL